MATSQTSESYITLNNFKKGVKRDASAYPIFKNEKYYNTFMRHFKATAKAQGLSTLMDPNFTPGSDEYSLPRIIHIQHPEDLSSQTYLGKAVQGSTTDDY